MQAFFAWFLFSNDVPYAFAKEPLLPYFKAFKQLSPPSLSGFVTDAECILRNEQFGMNIAAHVCWDGSEAFMRCPQRKSERKADLDDFSHFQVHLLPEADFDSRLVNRKTSWRNGTSYLMTSHMWPHNVQHVWPALNVVALGLPLRHLGLWGPPHWGAMGAKQPYCLGLMNALVDFLNLTLFPTPNLDNTDEFWKSFSKDSPLCLEKVVVPNKGPSPRFGTCTGAFMSPLIVKRQKQAFLEYFYAQARARVVAKESGVGYWLPSFPKTPPRKALIINRRGNRVMLNADEVVSKIEGLGLPVGLVHMEGLSLDEQFLYMAQAGILVAPHGANLINGLFMAPGSVVIEVYLLPYKYQCEWAQYLQSSGVQCLAYCWNNGSTCPNAPYGPYPRDNARVDVDRLKRTIKLAMRLIH